jgi:hypothetical protein
MQPDNNDIAAAKEAVNEAKRLFPNNDTVSGTAAAADDDDDDDDDDE